MKNLTPILEAIEHTRKRIHFLIDTNTLTIDSIVINELKCQIEMLESLLPKEREVIESAFESAIHCIEGHDWEYTKDRTEYFNETFNTEL